MAAVTPAERFAKLAALDPDEVITHSFVRDIPISGGKTLALITLDNGKDHTRPDTLGPHTLLRFAEVLDGQAARAKQGEIHGVAVTGKPLIFEKRADI